MLKAANMGVSIPYEQEGTFRLLIGDCGAIFEYAPSFNSLRTGRHIQTNSRCRNQWTQLDSFQFPTNGKAHSDRKEKNLCNLEESLVSIPYEREGTFRRIYKKVSYPQGIVSIPYEREGTFRQATSN